MAVQILEPNRTYDFERPDQNRCIIDVEGGAISVTPSSTGAVRVLCRVEPASADKYRFTANPDGSLAIEGRRTAIVGGDFGVQVLAQVPTDCVIELRVAGGSIEVGRHGASLTARVMGGSLRVQRVAGNLTVVAGGGSVAVDEVGGSVNVQTRGGSVRLGSVNGPVDVDIKGGSLRLSLTGQPEARLRTQAGDIRVSVPAAAGFKLLAAATAGRVKILAPLMAGGFDGTTFSGPVNAGGATTIDAQASAGNIILEAGAAQRTKRAPQQSPDSDLADAAVFAERQAAAGQETRVPRDTTPPATTHSDVYFDRSGREITLIREPGKIAVRFVRGRNVADAALSSEAKALLHTATPTTFLAEYGLQVFELAGTGDPGNTTRGLRTLTVQPDVQFATPVFRRSRSDLDIFVNNQVVLELKDTTTDAQFQAFNQANFLTVMRPLEYGRRGYVLATRDGDGEFGPIDVARRYFESGLVTYANPDLIQSRVPREARGTRVLRDEVPNGWRYRTEQWHLVTAKILDAWQVTQGAPNIRVAIADDGVDTAHVEFAGRVVSQFDFSADVANANPKLPSDRHGTACAGVAVAKGVAVRGAAPGCGLIAVRFPEQMGSIREGDMFHWMAANGADVISCSWGPPDGRSSYFSLPDNVASAIRHCLTSGRQGLGIPIFWAAGNGNEQISTDGYAANPDVIAIGATTEKDAKALYSDYGNELSVCAPSSGDDAVGERAIVTTDRSGGIGYNPDSRQPPRVDLPDADYTNNFGGTSSAAPLAAGVAALMLSANPALTHLEVRRILESSADKVGPLPYDAQGRNGVYGYGRINAKKAVDEAVRRIGAVGRAAISAPPTVVRDGPPLEFQITVPPGKYYAVEVGTDPLLFGPQRAARSANNFFASWETAGLIHAPRFTLPGTVWDRLRPANFLFYRLVVSNSQQAWVDITSTTPAANAAQAPSVKMAGAAATLQPTVTGPARHARSGPAPQFQTNPQPQFFYAFEVGNDPVLLTAAGAAQRSESNYFATWNAAPSFFAEPTYQLPDDVWQRLKASSRLYYRIFSNGAGGRWQTPVASHGNGASLPSVELT